MYTLPPSMEQRFKLYLNILPVAEQAIMYISFISGTLLTLITIYILTFKIMFKSKDPWSGNDKLKSNLWSDGKNNRNVYSPCEIPLDTDSEDDTKNSIGGTIRVLGTKLSDKVYDTVGSVKDKVANNVRNMFDVVIESDSSKSDTSEENFDYKTVKQSDSDDDCKYLEVIDDGMDFDVSFNKDKSKLKNYNDLVLHISD